tara:strand:- start:1741 stop:1986 length:246 start_codon:yes stop_codon:yes gene_type:complete
MTRYKLINGERVAFTAEEETARDTHEAAAAVRKAANKYKVDRIEAYGSIQEQLDQLYWDKKNGTNKWVEAIDKVKSDNPKR